MRYEVVEDTGEWATGFAETEFVQLAGRLIYVLHDLNTLQIDPAAEGIDVIVSGHSHVPKINTADGLLYVNPGSAGRRRSGPDGPSATSPGNPPNSDGKLA